MRWCVWKGDEEIPRSQKHLSAFTTVCLNVGPIDESYAEKVKYQNMLTPVLFLTMGDDDPHASQPASTKINWRVRLGGRANDYRVRHARNECVHHPPKQQAVVQ